MALPDAAVKALEAEKVSGTGLLDSSRLDKALEANGVSLGDRDVVRAEIVRLFQRCEEAQQSNTSHTQLILLGCYAHYHLFLMLFSPS
jgi:hypothetical protein